jgi:hypothetical protein
LDLTQYPLCPQYRLESIILQMALGGNGALSIGFALDCCSAAVGAFSQSGRLDRLVVTALPGLVGFGFLVERFRRVNGGLT